MSFNSRYLLNFSPQFLYAYVYVYVCVTFSYGFLAEKEPGRAERAFARYDYTTVMKKFLLITDNMIAPPDMEFIDFLDTKSALPAWLTEEDIRVFAEKFEESGFTGPFNYYRAMDL